MPTGQKKEMEGLTIDLTSFRQALADLQRQVDELDGIKAGYHEEVLEGEDEVSFVFYRGVDLS